MSYIISIIQSNIDVLGEPADAQGISKMGEYFLFTLMTYWITLFLSSDFPVDFILQLIIFVAINIIRILSIPTSLSSASLLPSCNHCIHCRITIFITIILIIAFSIAMKIASTSITHIQYDISHHNSTGGILLNLLSKYAMSVCDGVDGKGTTVGGEEMNDLYGGARLSYIFNEVRMCTHV